jgi:plastocyanin
METTFQFQALIYKPRADCRRVVPSFVFVSSKPVTFLQGIASSARIQSFTRRSLRVINFYPLSFTNKMLFSVLATALFSSVVLAADHLVTVGAGGALAFNPSCISNASEGDTVTFQFQAKNHSVTQSTFAEPCVPMTTPTVGVDSGFQFTANGTTSFAEWKITLNNVTAPLWFFCAQTIPKDHCQAGMVFAINPTAQKSFAAFKQAAMNSANTTVASSSASISAADASTSAGALPTPASGSVPPPAGAAGSASPMVTSLGSVPTASLPSAATGLTGAAVTGTPNTLSSTNGAVIRLPGASGFFLAALVAGLTL